LCTRTFPLDLITIGHTPASTLQKTELILTTQISNPVISGQYPAFQENIINFFNPALTPQILYPIIIFEVLSITVYAEKGISHN